MNDRNDFCGLSPQLVIPTTFEECFTYEEQILYLKQLIEESEGADLTEIEQRLSAVEASVANLNNEVAEINVDDIKAQLQTINAELTELKNTSSAQADSITALQTTVTTQGTEISSVKAQVETQATAVTNLSNSLSTTNNNVNRLNDELTETQTTLAGKQNTLTFDSTPTAGSTNPVTSGGIRTAIDEAAGATNVEWVETDIDQFLASLPDNVTYTTDINTNDINTGQTALVPTDIITGTFTRTGVFISSDKRYLKVVFNVTNINDGGSSFKDISYVCDKESSKLPFIYCAYYVTIRDEGDFIFRNQFYTINTAYSSKVYSTGTCTKNGTIQANSVFTCNVYFKLLPELPIDLT